MGVQKAVLKIGKRNKEAEDKVEYSDMQVQYNPSSLSFSSRAGLIEEDGPGEAGLGSHISAILPPETTLSFELIFEAVEEEDAFLSGTKQQSIEEALGKKRVQSADENKKARNQDCSVQQQIEELLALVMQTATKQVVFVWGNMSFSGVIEDVDARYTMFNPKGNPIYGTVSLTIRQSKADSDNETNSAEESYWKTAWNNFTKLAGKREETANLAEQYENTGELLRLDI